MKPFATLVVGVGQGQNVEQRFKPNLAKSKWGLSKTSAG